jgi:tetratricopeptide (TPR) repeat protein
MKSFTVSLFVFLLLFASCSSEIDKSDSDLKVQDQAMSKNLLQLVSKVKKANSPVDDCVRVANLLSQEMWPSGSEDFLIKYVRRYPSSDWLHYFLAKFYLDHNNFMQSRSAFSAIDFSASETLDFRIFEIELAQKSGSSIDVLDQINAAINVFPNNVVLHQLKLNAANQYGDSALVISSLKNALAHQVNDPIFSTQLLDIYYASAEFSSFDTLLRSTKVLFPYVNFSVYEAQSLMHKNDFDSARQLLLAGKTISALKIKSLEVLTDIYLQTGPLDSAVYYAQICLAKGGNATHQYYVMAKAYDKLGEFEKSYENYLKIQKIDKDFRFEVDELAKVERKISYLRQRRESND